MKLSGIYTIYCLSNKKTYVGSSVHIKRRWQEHRRMLKANNHHSDKLQRSWNKYGEKNFIFSIVEDVIDKIELTDKEQTWIDKLESGTREKGLNGRPYSDTGAWAKKSQSKKYILRFEDGSEQEIKNLSQWCRDNGFNQGALNAVASHRTNHHKNIHCRYAEESFEDWSKLRKDFIDSKPKKKMPCKKNTKGWIITKPCGEKIEVKSLTDFCSEHNLSQGNMTAIARGLRVHHKGFRCEYANSKTQLD